MGHSLRGPHCKGNFVPSRKQVAHKLSATKGSLLGPKRVSRPLLREDHSFGNRQHQSGCLHKQGRRHEIGLTLCPSVENPDLVFQETGNSPIPTHFRLAESDNRQTIQARPDHPDRVVSPSRCLPVDMHQVAPTSDLFAMRFSIDVLCLS